MCGCSDLDEQIGQLVDTTKSPMVNFAINNNDSESEESNENDLVEKAGAMQWKKQVHQ